MMTTLADHQDVNFHTNCLNKYDDGLGVPNDMNNARALMFQKYGLCGAKKRYTGCDFVSTGISLVSRWAVLQ